MEMSKSNQFLHRLRLFFDRDLKNKLAQKNDIKKILKKLNNKKRFILQTMAVTENAEEAGNLRRELHIIQAQRQKGIAIVKGLNNTDR